MRLITFRHKLLSPPRPGGTQSPAARPRHAQSAAGPLDCQPAVAASPILVRLPRLTCAMAPPWSIQWDGNGQPPASNPNAVPSASVVAPNGTFVQAQVRA